MFVPSLSWEKDSFNVKMASKRACFSHRIVTQRVSLSAIKLGAAHEPKRVDAVGFSCRNKTAFYLNFSLPQYVRPEPVLVQMIMLTYT